MMFMYCVVEIFKLNANKLAVAGAGPNILFWWCKPQHPPSP